ncbi:MAG TPA: biopolymer transporter ExbD [Kofleriaceae bacterium]|jgi:biopolymer transport protein ExbD
MAGTMGGARGRNATIAAINVTPLVDVVLVLLIILMVASTYIVAQTLKVTLPKSKTTDGTADKPQTVAIVKDGSLRWNGQPVTEPELTRDLAAAVKDHPDVNIVVSADESVKHGRVVHVIDVAKQQGVTRFAINVMAGAGE